MARSHCPDHFKKGGIQCKCPMKKGFYNIPLNHMFDISKSLMPEWLITGDYWVKITINDKAGAPVGCIETFISIKSKNYNHS